MSTTNIDRAASGASLISDISPPLDQQLAEALVREFVGLERRYVLADWEPATLDGGQFAEIASRLIYHLDSGNLNRRKSVHDCLSYIEDNDDSNTHSLLPRRTALHLCRVLRVLYKFRSARGAVHIDPEYDANELDASFAVAMARWIMAEILRVFWTGDTAKVARAIREIIRYDVPAVMEIDGRPLVLRTDCTAEEEVLLAIHNAGEPGLTRREIGRSTPKAASTVSDALAALTSGSKRQVVKRKDNRYALTPNGTRRILEELCDKLRVG